MFKVVVHTVAWHRCWNPGKGDYGDLHFFRKYRHSIGIQNGSKISFVGLTPPLNLYSGHRNFSFKLMLGAKGPLGSDGSFFNVPHLLISERHVPDSRTVYQASKSPLAGTSTNELNPPLHMLDNILTRHPR